MKKNIYITITSLLIITLLSLGIYFVYHNNINSGKEENKTKELKYMPLTYEICDDNNCIYLLGSIHVGDKNLTKFNKNLINYYNKSKYLAVELDTKNISMDVDNFIIPEEKTLDDYLNEDFKIKLTNFLKEKSILSYDVLKYFKLGYISNYISILPILELGMTENGVDEYFINLAHNENKEIIELETLEEQLSILLDYSNEFYINQINDCIDNYSLLKESLKTLYKTYLTGDKTKLEKILIEESVPETEEERNYEKAMIDDRNIKMSSKIEEFLKEDKDVFVIVGLAHVIGETGIINSLENKKYKITELK